MRGKIKNNKTTIIIIISLLLYAFIMYFFFGRPYLMNKNKQISIFTDGKVLMSYESQKWSQKLISDGVYENYNIYIDGKKFGKYNITPTDARLYLRKQNGQLVDFYGDFIGYSSNRKVIVNEYSVDFVDINDEYVDKALKEKNITNCSDLSVNQKITVDIDGDKDNEYIYMISNAFSMNENSDVSLDRFSLIFYVKNNKIRIIDFEDYGNAVISDTAEWFYMGNIQFYKDKLLMVRKQYYSMKKEMCNEIYQYKSDKFEKVLECK